MCFGAHRPRLVFDTSVVLPRPFSGPQVGPAVQLAQRSRVELLLTASPVLGVAGEADWQPGPSYEGHNVSVARPTAKPSGWHVNKKLFPSEICRPRPQFLTGKLRGSELSCRAEPELKVQMEGPWPRKEQTSLRKGLTSVVAASSESMCSFSRGPLSGSPFVRACPGLWSRHSLEP